MSAQPDKPAVPLDAEQTARLEALTSGLDREALLWVSGYAAGMAARAEPPASPAVAEAEERRPSPRLRVLYGSETGNARRTAERFAKDAEAAGLSVALTSTGEYAVRDLKKERYLLVVISTHGDGEPPDDALDFVEALNGKKAPRLDQLRYGVLALGDSSYPEFCATGRLVDQRLSEFGASRLVERGDCDVDIDTVAGPWWENTLSRARDELRQEDGDHAPASVTRLRPASRDRHDRDHPFHAELLTNQPLTMDDTGKDVRHVELDIGGAGLAFEPGDSLGVWHRNPPAVVDAVLAATGLDGNQEVDTGDGAGPLARVLAERCEITRLTRGFLEQHARHCADNALAELLSTDRRRDCAAFLGNHQLVDLLQRWPAAWTAEELVASLPGLTPRLYSIASSIKAIDDEVHLTVERLAYESAGFERLGAASNHLAGLDGDDAAAVYLEPNKRFRLPADPDRDIIMVGPGTGVAPFRAFVQERAALGARGRNWLFFGARHFRTQFLYQLEWQRALKADSLHRLDLAFSRDQEERIYVQHRLAERGRDVFAWLEEGAHFYVCGAIAMEKDVRDALVALVQHHGAMNAERAREYVAELRRQGRYSRDVY